MRIFPNAWVIPGGHVDYDETLEQSVVREINEEIGVGLNKEELTQLEPLFLFESISMRT